MTTSHGTARATWTLGPTPGTQSIEATIAGGAAPVVVTATALDPTSAPTLVLESEPQAKSAKPAKRGRAPAAKTARAKKSAPAAAEKAAPKAKRPRAKKTTEA